MYDIIIIGAGPAGLAAAIYARRASKKVLLLEAKSYGGKIVNANCIENYPGFENIDGFDFATRLYNQAINLGSKIIYEKVIKIKNDIVKEVITANNNTYKAKALIIATGSDHRKLGLDGEDKLLGRGISYCASCDGNFYKNKIVAVVGGGSTALEDALYLTDIAKKVYLIHRRDEFSGEEKILSSLKKKDNIEFIYNSIVTKLNYKEKLDGIDVKDKDGNIKTISVDGLFIAVGMVPENENFREIIKMDSAGYIISSEDCHTNVSGIFVAGDNRVKILRQLVTATNDGAIAAVEAIKYINNERK